MTAVSEVREKCKFYWTINNFADVYEASQVSKYIESTKFKVRIHDFVTEWQLVLYPKGKKEIIGKNKNKRMSLTLRYLSNADAYVMVRFQIKSSVKYRPWYYHDFGYTLFKVGNDAHLSEFCTQKDILDDEQGFLNEGKLTIQCEIVLDKASLYFEKIQNGKIEEIDNVDFGMLYMDKKLSDVTLLINNGNAKHRLHAHRYVLSQMSYVFADMFEHDIFSKKTVEVNITDVPLKAMKVLLRFIYTGQIVDLEDFDYQEYKDLYRAADKYALKRGDYLFDMSLKFNCEQKILDNLSLENVTEFLIFADQNNADYLKKECIKLILQNAETVVNKPEFKSLMESNVGVAHDVICKIVSEHSGLKKKRKIV